MWNQHGGDMETAISSIPKDTDKDDGYSTPDIYGRAAQFYFSLRMAARESLFTDEAVRVWRGLLTMLALRNVLNIPLRWEAVDFPADNLFSAALSRPPREKRQLLYPDESAFQWDGKTFYVLTWAPNGVRQRDLAIYSPMTLLYPVTEWHRVFFDISGDTHVLDKFFYRAQEFSAGSPFYAMTARAQNVAASTFRDCLSFFEVDGRKFDFLHAGERKLVYRWLETMRNHLPGRQVSGVKDADAEAGDIIREHLERYMQDLRGSLGGASSDNLVWEPFPEYDAVRHAGLPYPLISACDIPGGAVFADQICYFQVDRNSERPDNPFEPCRYAPNYKIEGQLDPNYDLYAFLPIHPGRRETCLDSGLAGSVHMEIIPGSNKSKTYIRVSARLNSLGDFSLERDYLISPTRTDKPGTAVCYKYWDTDEDAVLDYGNWPLISVWPDVIGTGWNEYYVMRSQRFLDNLQLYNETLWESNPNAPVTKGSNDAVVKTSYVPDAIPFVREMPSGKSVRQVSVGMVTPRTVLRHSGSATATVAVDVGAFFTRVFYSTGGSPMEIVPSEQDKPLEVTKLYNDSNDKYEEMGQSFISPRPPMIKGASLLSIFRRSEPVNKSVVPPLLEGVIYHPDSYTNFDYEDPQLLVTDLKWGGDTAAPYYMAFMQQLGIHVMSILYRERGVNMLNWVYALPKSMEHKRGDMMRVWENLTAFLNRTAGIIQSHALSPVTDIVAASRYFAANYTGAINKKKGFLVANIGERSTDVALWRSEDGDAPATLRWYASADVGRRRIFTAWIERLLPEIDASVSNVELKKLIRSILEPREPLSAEDKSRMVEHLLNSYGDVLKEDYSRLWESGTIPWATNLCHHLTQSATLLMFCLGYQVGALMNSKIKADGDTNAWYEEPLFLVKSQAVEPGYFSIAFAGRGFLMWDWLRDCKDKRLCEFFKVGISAAGARWPDVEIRIVRTDDPTGVVGKGLLETPVNLDMSEEGWGDLSYSDRLDEEMENDAFYHMATYEFLKAYYQAFSDPTLYELHWNTLAGYVQWHKPTLNNAFKILLESIYGCLET